MAVQWRDRFRLSRFFTGEKPSGDAVTLSHRRIFILPSKQGIVFGLLIGLLLIASVVYNNNLGFVLTFLLFNLFFLSTLHSFRNLTGLTVRTAKGHAVFAGERAALELSIAHDSNTPRVNIVLKLEQGTPQRIDIAPHASTQVRLPLKTLGRGWVKVGTITLYSYFPLGLLRAWSPLRLDHRLLAYPRPAEQSEQWPYSGSDNNASGRRQHEQDDFYGFRGYQPGDPLKHIHWKGVAKRQGVYTKQYSGAHGSASELWFDWRDTVGSHTEARLSRLCRWIVDAERQGIRYGLRLPAETIDPDQGSQHYSRCLTALALFPS